MKSTIHLFIFLFFINITLYAQELSLAPSSPGVSSLMQYESNPVDIATGIPNVAIPLYSMPTVSKDLKINIGLNYHSLSVVAYDSISGNCGRGWTLSIGGAISRETGGKQSSDVIANQLGLYYFNFMGYSGKFNVERNGNEWTAIINENKGNPLIIVVNVDTNSTILSFTINDQNGTSYNFAASEQYRYIESVFNPNFQAGFTPQFQVPYKTAYKLTSISNITGHFVAHFEYETTYPEESYYQNFNNIPAQSSVRQEVNQIIVPNYGKFEFNKLYINDAVRYNEIIVKDLEENKIKKFNFQFTDRNLTQVNETNVAQTEILSHKMDYRTTILTGRLDLDSWGYYTSYDEDCYFNYDRSKTRIATKHATRDVLEKLTLPSGGCIIYNYEPNTYAYKDGVPIDSQSFNSSTNQSIINNDYFTVLNKNTSHNFNKINYFSQNFSSSGLITTTFTVSGAAKQLYFQIDSPGYIAEFQEGNPMRHYPNFYVTGNASFQPVNFEGGGGCYSNSSNGGFGWGQVFPVGTYTIIMASGHATTGIVNIYTAELKANPNRGYLGNGIRIKNIAYFSDGGVNQRYYDFASTLIPDREISYDYSMFGTNRSSGSISTSITVRNGRMSWG